MYARYSRRGAMKLGLAGLGSLALPGLVSCADTPQASTTQAGNNGPVAMKMLFWGSATRNQLTTKVIDLFHQNHNPVSISTQYTGFNTYFPMLDGQIAHKHTPDLIQMDMRYVANYVRDGVLLELSELIYNQTINLTDFDAQQVLASKVNNGIYGVSLGSNYHCMFYDKTRLTQAGFQPPTAGMNWETCSEYMIELAKAAGHGLYGIADYSGTYDSFEVWIRSRGKELYTVDGQLAFDQTDAADWFNYWDHLRKTGGCPPGTNGPQLDASGTPVDSSVMKGVAIFSHIFSNQFVAFQAATKHELALNVYPVGVTPGMYIKASQLLSIAANTPHLAEAASFVSFFVTDPGAVKVLGFERGLPASRDALAYLRPAFTPAQETIVNFINYITSNGFVRPKEILEPPGSPHVLDALTKIAQQISVGSLSVSAGAQSFYAQAKKATQS